MSYAHLGTDTRKARRGYHCVWCGEPIHPGETHLYRRGVFEGEFQADRWHPECEHASAEYFRLEFPHGSGEFCPETFKRGTIEEK